MDVGCDDFEKAALNRERIAKKQNVLGYIEVEIALKGCPFGKPLPKWIPQGKLPTISEEELKKLRRLGFFRVDN